MIRMPLKIMLVLGPLEVASVGGADDDTRARADMRRDHYAAPVFELARLVGGRRRLAPHDRIGFDDFHYHIRRQLDRQCGALVQHHLADHGFAQKIGWVADRLARDRDLLEGVVVHKRRQAAVHKQELHFLLVEAHPLDRFLGSEALVQFRPAAQIAQLDLGEGAAFAGLNQFALQHEPELVLVLEHVARLDIDGIDFHWRGSREGAGWIVDPNIGRRTEKNEGRTMQEWWRPDHLPMPGARLDKRGRILAAVRSFFTDRGFVEVDTPALQVSPGLEPHLRAFATELHNPHQGQAALRYLHTSPEFAMKKLLVAGMPRIWQLAHVFRDGERSATHHPEFSMLEWYRSGASWRELIPDCIGLLRMCQAAASVDALAWRGHSADAGRVWREISVVKAFQEHCGIDIL